MVKSKNDETDPTRWPTRPEILPSPTHQPPTDGFRHVSLNRAAGFPILSCPMPGPAPPSRRFPIIAMCWPDRA